MKGTASGSQAGTKPQGVYPIKTAAVSVAGVHDIVKSRHHGISS